MSREKDRITALEFLGQRWSGRDPSIRDYACNFYADKIAGIDVLIESLPEDSKKRRLLERVRKILIKQGEALWIMHADPFTQLCLKVGSTVRKISGKRKYGGHDGT